MKRKPAKLPTIRLIDGPCEHLLPFVENERERLMGILRSTGRPASSWYGEIGDVKIALRAWANDMVEGASVRMSSGELKYYDMCRMPDPVPYRDLFLNTVFPSSIRIFPGIDAAEAALLANSRAYVAQANAVIGYTYYADPTVVRIPVYGIAQIDYIVLNATTLGTNAHTGNVVPLQLAEVQVPGVTQHLGHRLEVTMSNGQVLATVPQEYDESSGYYQPHWTTTEWVGTSSAPISFGVPNQSETSAGEVYFDVPADTRSPSAAYYFLEIEGGVEVPFLTWGTALEGAKVYLRKQVGNRRERVPVPIFTYFFAAYRCYYSWSWQVCVYAPPWKELFIGTSIRWWNYQWYWMSGYWTSEPNGSTVIVQLPDPDVVFSKFPGELEGINREIKRNQTNSKTVVEQLSSGMLPGHIGIASWAAQIKLRKPESWLPRVVLPFTAQVVGSDPSGPLVLGAPFTGFDVTIQRRIDGQFTNAEGEVFKGTVAGTWRQYEVIHSKLEEYLMPRFCSYTNIFNNYPVFEPTHGTLDTVFSSQYMYAHPDRGPYIDGALHPQLAQLGPILNGTLVFIGTADSFGGVDHHPNSLFGWPTNPIIFYDMTPPVPYFNSDIDPKTFDLFLQYQEQVRPVSVTELDPQPPRMPMNWLSTNMVVGEIVTVIPFAPVTDGVDLGLFGDPTEAQEVVVYGQAKYQYKLDGSFAFKGWTDAIPATENSPGKPKTVLLEDELGRIEWAQPEGYIANCMLVFEKFEWEDLKRMVREREKQPAISYYYRFRDLIKQAVGV